jgi:hypothetical protein
MAFEPLGERRDYPTVCGNPAIALSLNFAKAAVNSPNRWREFFGQPLPANVTRPCPLTEADRGYFLGMQEASSGYPPCSANLDGALVDNQLVCA